jgi:hypothetical protein
VPPPQLVLRGWEFLLSTYEHLSLHAHLLSARGRQKGGTDKFPRLITASAVAAATESRDMRLNSLET